MSSSVLSQPGQTTAPAVFRSAFPILETVLAGGKPLIYLDNAATSQKPDSVIAALVDYYTHSNSNIHRGAHQLAARATDAYEGARKTVAAFIGCADPALINFTSGTTQGINLVASGLAKSWLQPGDEVLISAMEHHANIVPWQMACQASGAVLRVAPLTGQGELDLEAFRKLLTPRTKVVAMVWISNALGSINPVERIVQEAQAVGAQVLIDAAQAIVHETIDVETLGADYLVFSGHKVYGPTGIGILYGRRERMEVLPPYQGGGEMIREVRFEGSTYNQLPYKFEAGTPNIAGGIGLGAALNFVTAQDREALARHEQALLERTLTGLDQVEGLTLYGPRQGRSSLVSFTVEGVHAFDIGVLLDQQGIAVRTGHHCCQPLMRQYGIEGTCRASFLPYNTFAEVDQFLHALNRALAVLRA
ncbi:MAG: SufS family cysteine desulfurase [Bacteroidetes bacterium]|nr:SufS family cysteine desulfurase [Bacteroidota bacterium]